jgi:hypothetical protein
MRSSQNYKLQHTIDLQQSPSSTDQSPSQNSQTQIEILVVENGFPPLQTQPQVPAHQMFHSTHQESLLENPVCHWYHAAEETPLYPWGLQDMPEDQNFHFIATLTDITLEKAEQINKRFENPEP